MSKSLKRVKSVLEAAGLGTEVLEMTEQTRTAQQAADAAGCALDQIVKSIIFQGHDSRACILFLSAGGNKVDAIKASALVGEPLDRADAAAVRAQTGFAIGGVAPVGHVSPIQAFWDPRLSDFDLVYAAAGTPRHIFPIDPTDLIRLSAARIGDFVSG